MVQHSYQLCVFFLVVYEPAKTPCGIALRASQEPFTNPPCVILSIWTLPKLHVTLTFCTGKGRHSNSQGKTCCWTWMRSKGYESHNSAATALHAYKQTNKLKWKNKNEKNFIMYVCAEGCLQTTTTATKEKNWSGLDITSPTPWLKSVIISSDHRVFQHWCVCVVPYWYCHDRNNPGARSNSQLF